LKINKILGIDFEEHVVNKMNTRGVPIEYKVGDVMDMNTIDNNSFDFVLDKGTLDALCVDRSQDT
jgi:ubiquinone/menaquinone biosynthesis C-methylase UbiE